MNHIDEQGGRAAATDQGAASALSTRAQAHLAAAHRLLQPLAALETAMGEIERITLLMSHTAGTPMAMVEQAKWHEFQHLTQSPEGLAASLAVPTTARHILDLLAPSLTFPAATPIETDDNSANLHALRLSAEQHKENLRRLIEAEIRQLHDEADAD